MSFFADTHARKKRDLWFSGLKLRIEITPTDGTKKRTLVSGDKLQESNYEQSRAN
jgi:hypothetical protein